MLRDVGIDQKLDEAVPLDLEFFDEAGRPVRLREFFGTRPVVLALVYYECPMLCTQVLNGLVGSLEGLTFNPGEDFDRLVDATAYLLYFQYAATCLAAVVLAYRRR